MGRRRAGAWVASGRRASGRCGLHAPSTSLHLYASLYMSCLISRTHLRQAPAVEAAKKAIAEKAEASEVYKSLFISAADREKMQKAEVWNTFSCLLMPSHTFSYLLIPFHTGGQLLRTRHRPVARAIDQVWARLRPMGSAEGR